MERSCRPQADRFWEKVNKSGPVPVHRPELGRCWIWTACNVRGYGRFVVASNRKILAHRWSLEQSIGRSLLPGRWACHRCDNPSCVNPDHLFEGMPADNEKDKMAKGRHLVMAGELNGNAKLSDDTVRQIRSRRAAGESCSSIATSFGVTPCLISRVALGRAWRHVDANV